MVKPANCGVCGEKDGSKFYYGQKKLCKTCYAKKMNKDYVSNKAKLSDVIETFNQKFNEYEARIVSLETVNSDVIETLKIADNKISELEEQIKILTLQKTVPRARSPSPKPKSRSPSPVRARSPRSSSGRLSPVRARSPVKSRSPVRSNLLPLPEIPTKRFSCQELDNFEKSLIYMNGTKMKELAAKLQVKITENGKAKNVDKLRTDIREEIARQRTI
jgi:hypothetical protein